MSSVHPECLEVEQTGVDRTEVCQAIVLRSQRYVWNQQLARQRSGALSVRLPTEGDRPLANLEP